MPEAKCEECGNCGHGKDRHALFGCKACVSNRAETVGNVCLVFRPAPAEPPSDCICPELGHEHQQQTGEYAGQCFAQIDADMRTCYCPYRWTPSGEGEQDG